MVGVRWGHRGLPLALRCDCARPLSNATPSGRASSRCGRRHRVNDDGAPFVERLFGFVPEEGAYRVESVEGEIPRFLRGSYYVNGPARFRRGDLAYKHWLDGDGMVVAI